jgi:hypothetical protein
MGNLTLNGSTSGQITVSPPAVAGTNTLTLPAATGTLALTASPIFSGTVTATTVTSPASTALTIQSAGTTAMTIDTSQNVGIGTNSPGALLELSAANSSVYSAIRLTNTTGTGTTPGAGIEWARGGSVKSSIVANTFGNDYMSFSVNGNTERMRIDTNGNVGIGTTSPLSLGGATLQVQNSSIGAVIWSNGTYIGQLLASAAAEVSVGSRSNHPLRLGTNDTERMRIDTLGAVLIGTSSRGTTNSNSFTFQPGDAYSVFNHINGTSSGTSYINFGYNGAGVGSISQNGTTGVLYNITSDQRLKTNIVDAPSASSIIDAIQIRSFDWKADGSHNRYGVIAQELNQLVPEAVHTPIDENEMMGVDYSKLVPHLIKYVQELSAKVTALEAKVGA